MADSPFTERELAILYHHGTRGFIFNAAHAARKAAIEDWKSDDHKHEQLRAFNEHFDMSHVDIDTGHANRDYSELRPGLVFPDGMFAATEESPFDGPGVSVKQIGDEFARDVAKHFERELTRLLEGSTLSKKQFLVFVLLWQNPREYPTGRQLGERGVAEYLGIAVGTVRSHHARAKKKIEKAEFTAGLTDYAKMDVETAPEETKRLLDEKL